MAVAAISNCASRNNRLAIVKQLMSHGVTIHSIGKCLHNYDVPAAYHSIILLPIVMAAMAVGSK